MRFQEEDLSFDIVGMSDLMPYPCKRWRDPFNLGVDSYEKVFGAKLVSLVQDIQPDLIHSHHLGILTALIRRTFPELPVVAACHGSFISVNTSRTGWSPIAGGSNILWP